MEQKPIMQTKKRMLNDETDDEYRIGKSFESQCHRLKQVLLMEARKVPIPSKRLAIHMEVPERRLRDMIRSIRFSTLKGSAIIRVHGKKGGYLLTKDSDRIAGFASELLKNGAAMIKTARQALGVVTAIDGTQAEIDLKIDGEKI